MAVYKNGIEYDMSYQIEKGSGAIPKPNTLNLVTAVDDDTSSFLEIDNTWLPYFKPANGYYRMFSRGFNDLIKTLWIETETYPFATYEQFQSFGEQYYIKNLAEYGFPENDEYDFSGYISCPKFTYVDEKNEDTTAYLRHIAVNHSVVNSALVTIWQPKAQLTMKDSWEVEEPAGVIGTLIMAADATKEPNLEKIWDGRFPWKEIYLNEDLHQVLQDNEIWNEFLENRVVGTFNVDETEWLENYFTIAQNGQTLEWFEGTITNEQGKYIRLKKDGNIIAEKCYWKDKEISINIGINLEDETVTKTGTIEGHDYSINQKGIERTIKFRVYFDTNDGEYKYFSVWPFAYGEDDWQQRLKENPSIWDEEYMYGKYLMDNVIKRVRIKKATDTEWTTLSMSSYDELWNKANEEAARYGSYVFQIKKQYATEINETGFYDLEYCMIFPDKNYLPSLGSHEIDLHRWLPGVSNWRCTANYYMNDGYESSFENTDEIHFNTSVDYGQQIVYNVSNNDFDEWWAKCILAEWDHNRDFQTYSFSGVDNSYNEGRLISSNGSIRHIVLNDVKNLGNTAFEINNDNETTLWYNSDRIAFPDWWLGMSSTPKAVYLRKDIYAMENHGFDGTVTGWDQWKYEQWLENGVEILELPDNWKELVPNYIGE